MRHSFRTILVLALCVLQLTAAAAAFAAPAAWEGVDVVSHSEKNGGVVTVVGTLPESTQLPAQATLSVPAGAQIQWVGEILGGDPAEDPTLTYTKTTANGIDTYSFTMTKSRTAQIEMLTAVGAAFDGTTYSESIQWVATQDIPTVRLAIRVPAGAAMTSSTPDAATVPGETGYDYYTKTITGVKAGDNLALNAVYTVPAAAPAANTGSNSGNVATIIIIAMLAVAGVALVISLRRKMGGGTVVDDDDDEESPAPVRTPAKQAVQADATTDADEDEAAPAARSGASKRTIVTAAIVGVIVLVAVILGSQAGKPQVVGDTVMETYSAQEPCATVSIALATSGDDDPNGTGKQMFDAIRPLAGLTTATYNFKANTLSVGFCESETSEEAIRAALAPTGLVAE